MQTGASTFVDQNNNQIFLSVKQYVIQSDYKLFGSPDAKHPYCEHTPITLSLYIPICPKINLLQVA